MPPTEGVMLLSSPLGSVEWMTQEIIDQWRGKGADTMPIASRAFMGLAGKLTMVGMMGEGQAQDARIRYVALSWLSYLTRTGPLADQFHSTLHALQDKVDAARRAMDTLPEWKQIPTQLLAQTEPDLTYTETLISDMLLSRMNAP